MKEKEKKIIHYNNEIQKIKEKEGVDLNNISDGYHTFGELYKHRHHLFIALCKIYSNGYKASRSKIHNDGLDVWEKWGMFLLCLHTKQGQISYHLPNEYWDSCSFAVTEEIAKIPWDGHTSDDVLERLLKI